jgi:hypothetical protein
MLKRHRSGSVLGLAAAAVVLVVGAAACGGSSSAKAAATTTTTTAAGGRAGALAAYRTCLSQHGVNLPKRTPRTGGPPSSGTGTAGGGFGGGGFGGGGFGGGGLGGTPRSLPPGVTASQYAAAQKACASKLPTGGFGRGGLGSPAFQAYTSCLRDHGVTIPGATTQTTTAGSPRPTFNRNDPKFVAANQICRALLPTSSTTTSAG